jgi:hypothetical protein
MRTESAYSNYSAAATAVAFAPAPLRVRLWIICDEGAELTYLNALLLKEDAVMTRWMDLLATRRSLSGVEIVVVDVAPACLPELLRMLREELACEQSAILVNVRAHVEPPPCGVLPRYRAMACGWNEIMRLAQNRLREITNLPSSSILL